MSLNLSMYQKIFNIKKKKIVITGADGLIGSKIFNIFKKLGADVYPMDINLSDPSIFELKNKDKKNVKFVADVSNLSHIKKIYNYFYQNKISIDVLINAHQIKPKGFLSNKPENFDEDLWKQIIEVNLTGTFLTCKYFGRMMIKKKKGSIINIGSTYGIVSSNESLYKGLKFGNPIAYSASKGGVSSLTKYLASHWGKYNIRVNCLIPHGVENNQSTIFKKRFSNQSPLNRMMKVDEIIGPAIFLSSDASSYCTGSNFLVEGGWTAW